MPVSKSPKHAAAALIRVSREGGAAVSAPARAAFDQRFVDQVDPDRVLPDDERARRVSAARRAYFLMLSAKSVESRERRAAAAELRALADEVDAEAGPTCTGKCKSFGIAELVRLGEIHGACPCGAEQSS